MTFATLAVGFLAGFLIGVVVGGVSVIIVAVFGPKMR